MKKALGICLAMALMVTVLVLLSSNALAHEVASGIYRDQVTWTLDDSGTLTISGTGYVDYDMGHRGLFGEIKTVVVEEGITALGENAFNGFRNMTSVSLPSTLTEIGPYAFKKCEKLEQIQIPEGVIYIGFNAFEGCSALKQIRIPDGVTTIWGRTFKDCTGLEQIDIPENVTMMEGRAFLGCSSLRQIVIPSGVTVIEEETFSGCTGLTTISIPHGVTCIADRAFAGCSGLKTVWIPATVQDLALDSFEDCGKLKRVMYGGSRRDFWNLMYAELGTSIMPEEHSLYSPRLVPRCVVTGIHWLDVAVVVTGWVMALLLIVCAGGVATWIIVRTKKRNERII